MAEEDDNYEDFDWRGSIVQAVGIILGFSLAFLGKWSLGDGVWHVIHLPALVCLVGGCAILIYTIYHLTHTKYHDNDDPTHAVRVFTLGISLTLAGFVLAIVAAWIKGY